MLQDSLNDLGIDPEDFSWDDLALCAGLDTSIFFEPYEERKSIKTVDEMCFKCPVQSQCLKTGIERNETGVWGGFYLSLGKVDKKRNAHKTQEHWDHIRELIMNG